MRNNKGQAMILGIIMLVIGIIIFISMLSPISSVISDARGCSSLNCAGYVDSDSTTACTVADTCCSANQTHISSLEENSLGCTSLDLFIPILVLAFLGAAAWKVMRKEEQQPVYPGY